MNMHFVSPIEELHDTQFLGRSIFHGAVLGYSMFVFIFHYWSY